MQEDGSYALELLSKYIRLAGYRSDTMVQKNFAFSSVSHNQIKDHCDQQDKSFSNGQIITGGDEQDVDFEDDDGKCEVAKIDGKKYQSDWIIIRYHGNDDGSMADCFGSNTIKGNIIDDQQTIVNAFFIREDDEDEIAKANEDKGKDKYKTFSLFCERKIFDKDMQEIKPTRTEAFARGIEGMQIQYGVNNSGDPTKGVQAYLNANNVVNWNTVISVKVALLVRSDINIADKEQPYIFPPWDDEKNSITPSTGDFRLRHVFTTTINLRNQSQALSPLD